MTSVAKEFHRLLKRVNRLTDGQASIDDINWDEAILQKFDVVVRPNDGHYKGGKFVFTISLPVCYPSEVPPSVWCQTDVYHPNIDPTDEQLDEWSTNVCLNLLEAGVWSPSFGLEGLIHGLVFLMHNPNLDDPFSPYFEEIMEDDTFSENVKKYMSGEPVYDHVFHVDFGIMQEVKLEQIDKESAELHKEVAEDNTATSETGISSSTDEKSDSKGSVEDSKDEYIGLLSNIPNCNKEMTPESEVGNTVEANCDHENDGDNLHNELMEKTNSIDGTMDMLHNKDDNDPENDTDTLMFDGECLFLPWTKYGDNSKSNTSMNDNSPELTKLDASIETECAVDSDMSVLKNVTECTHEICLSGCCLADKRTDVKDDTIDESIAVLNEVDTCNHDKRMSNIRECTENSLQICEYCIQRDSNRDIPEKDCSALGIADIERNSQQCPWKVEENFEGPEMSSDTHRRGSGQSLVSQSDIQSSATCPVKLLGWMLFLYERLL